MNFESSVVRRHADGGGPGKAPTIRPRAKMKCPYCTIVSSEGDGKRCSFHQPKPAKGLTTRQVQAITGATYRQLDYWATTGLVGPSLKSAHGSGSRRRYSEADLEQVKVIVALIDFGMAVPGLRKYTPEQRVRLLDGLPDLVGAA